MRNPEFQRQLWLNWRPSLIFWSLGLTALVLAAATTLGSDVRRAGTLGVSAFAGLWLAACVYGSVLASRSLAEEARQNTWDWQRLSALSPWQMAWGKLLGSALPAWLYALWFALVLLFVSATFVIEGGRYGLHTVLLAVLWGLALQSWAMNSVLIGWGQRGAAGRRQMAWLPLLALLFLLPVPVLRPLLRSLFSGSDETRSWWGLDLGNLGMSYVFGAVLLGLGLLALWRQLCARLDMRTLPWAWPLGLAICGLAAGGLSAAPLAATLAYISLFALTGTAYIALATAHEGLRSWRQVQWSASQGQWRAMLQAVPLWPVSWLLALAATLLLLLPGATPAGPALPVPANLALMLNWQLLRDALLLTGFSLLAGRLKSPVAVFAICWITINGLLPMIAAGLLGSASLAATQPTLALLLRGGEPALRPALPWGSALAQLLLVAGWVALLFRRHVLGFARESQPTQM